MSFLVCIMRPKITAYSQDTTVLDREKVVKTFFNRAPKFGIQPACSFVLFNPKHNLYTGPSNISNKKVGTVGSLVLKDKLSGAEFLKSAKATKLIDTEVGGSTMALFLATSNSGLSKLPPIRVGSFIGVGIGEIFAAKKVAKEQGISLPNNITCTADLVALLTEKFNTKEGMPEQEAFTKACKLCFGPYSYILLSTKTSTVFVAKKDEVLKIKTKCYKDLLFMSNNTNLVYSIIREISYNATEKIVIDANDLDVPRGYGITLFPTDTDCAYINGGWVEKCQAYRLT